MTEQKFRIGITQGDPNGIGWEVIIKALADPRITEFFTPVIYGSTKAAACYRNAIAEIEQFSYVPVASAAEARRGRINLVACGEIAEIQPGKPTPEAGRAAVEALRTAMRDLKAGELDALVTAPFDKETVQSDDFRHTGHTEYLAAELEGESMMIMCSDVLRVGLVTKHIPVSEIAASISKEKIVGDLRILRRSLVEDFGVVEPRIAVMALNPHAGDGGLLGREEQEIIRPAIVEAFREGVLAFGPFFTAGLAAVRTSPDHGTAFDIAGKDKADPQSMRNAIYTAIDIVRNRAAWSEWSSNPLPRAEREKSGRDATVKETPQAAAKE